MDISQLNILLLTSSEFVASNKAILGELIGVEIAEIILDKSNDGIQIPREGVHLDNYNSILKILHNSYSFKWFRNIFSKSFLRVYNDLDKHTLCIPVLCVPNLISPLFLLADSSALSLY